MKVVPTWLNISSYGGGAFDAPAKRRGLLAAPAFRVRSAQRENTMRRTPFIVLILLTMSAASRAATHDFDSFTGVGWVWIAGLSFYAVLGVIILALCKSAGASDAIEDKTYAATLKQAGARQGLSHFDWRNADQPSVWPDTLGRLNYADFEARFLDVHILSSDKIVVRVDDTERTLA